jgi:fluoroquinolone transport system permease protein
MKYAAVLMRGDFKRLRRDSFLLFMLSYPWLLALVLAWLLPYLAERLADRVALVDYYPILVCLLVVMIPYVMGIVLGFQVLEEKDANCLAAIAVTPVSLARYFAYRAAVYMLAGLPLVLVLHEMLALVDIPLWALVVVALAAAPATPLMALIVAGFARNQVEGFAVTKASGFTVLVLLASFFIARPWDLAVGVLPTYWPVKAYFAATEGQPGWVVAAALVALAYQACWVRFLFRRLRRQI